MEMITIVITVYNQELYIDECLHSLEHLLKYVNIVVADDGSQDNSFKILEGWACKYPDSIYIFTQQNKGVSAARNKSLEFVRTPYVSFVDGDDALDFSEDEFLKILDILNEGWDIIQYPMLCNWDSKFEKLKSSSLEIIGSQRYLESYIKGILSYSCCDKFFKTSLFSNNKFPHGRRYEDVYFLLSIADLVSSVKTIPFGRYLYRYNHLSFSLQVATYKKVEDFIYVIHFWNNQVSKYNLSLYWFNQLKIYVGIEAARFQSDIPVINLFSPILMNRRESFDFITKNMVFRNKIFLLSNALLGKRCNIILFSYLFKLKKILKI